MAEPTITTGALWAAATAAMAGFFASIGVPWQAVLFAVLGAMFGAPMTAGLGRVRAVLAFPASSLIAAKFGTLAAAYWFASSTDWAGGLAIVCAIGLHPAIADGLKILPAFGARVAGVAPPSNGDTQ